MTTPPTPAPEFTVEGGPPSPAAISALARLLLAAVDADLEHETTNAPADDRGDDGE